MSDNKNGFAKNLEVVKAEIEEWQYQMEIGLRRFKQGSWSWGKQSYFHLAMNLVTETFRALPRTMAYSFVLVVVVGIVVWLL